MQENSKLVEVGTWKEYSRPAGIGAAIGLFLIVLFVASVDETNPEWGTFWMLRPLLIVPLAGAAGGAVRFYLQKRLTQLGLHQAVGFFLGLFALVVALWMGFVLGLDGTFWN